MNEQNTLCGHPVVAVLKPGDIVVVEVNKQVHAQHWVTLKQFLSESAERLGIKILVLPPDVKVARVMVDGVDAKERTAIPKLTPSQAQHILDAYDIDVMLQDEGEVDLLMRSNPDLLEAYNVLREIANTDE